MPVPRSPARLSVAVAASVTAFACAAPGPGPAPILADPDSAPRASVQVVGHRGARAVRPENTLAAFEHALEAGADVLELDLAVTLDDRLLVVHDLRVNPDLCLQPGGRPPPDRVPIRSMTFDDLRRLDCGTLRNPRFPDQVPVPGQRLPSFEEVAALVRTSPATAARTARLLVEMKTVPGRPDLGPPPDRLADLLVPAFRDAGLPGRITLQSFDHVVLRAVHARDPSLPLAALVAEDRCADPVAVARAANAGTLAPNHEWITAEDVRSLHAAGLRVVPWTANGAAAWDRLLGLGVDGIITDDPAGLVDALRRKGMR